MGEPRRIAWIDLAKGVGIVLVVAGHVNRGLVGAGLMTESPAFQATDSFIYAFHMPLFFFLSGLLARSTLERRSAATFMADRARTLAYPYLVWSLLQVALQVALSSYTNTRLHADAMLTLLFEPVMHFWFLYALLVIYTVAYALRRIGLSPAAILGVSAVCYLGGAFWMPSWSVAVQSILHAPYFALGLWLAGPVRRRVPELSARASWVACALGYATLAWAVVAGPAGYSWAPVLALVGIVATLGLSAGLAARGHEALLRTLGQRSLEIYLAHTLAAAGVRVVLSRVLHVESLPVHMLAGLLAGLGGPLLLYAACSALGLPNAFQWTRPSSLPRPTARPAATRGRVATLS